MDKRKAAEDSKAEANKNSNIQQTVQTIVNTQIKYAHDHHITSHHGTTHTHTHFLSRSVFLNSIRFDSARLVYRIPNANIEHESQDILSC